MAQQVEVELVAEFEWGLHRIRMAVRLLSCRYMTNGNAGTDDHPVTRGFDKGLDPICHHQVVVIKECHVLRSQTRERHVKRACAPSAGDMHDTDASGNAGSKSATRALTSSSTDSTLLVCTIRSTSKSSDVCAAKQVSASRRCDGLLPWVRTTTAKGEVSDDAASN